MTSTQDDHTQGDKIVAASDGRTRTGERGEAPASGETQADAYRVLIVEDDRSQALFAEGVLHGAGMRTRWVDTAAGVMPAISEFDPELVLMDLHLPGTNGADLTAAIRARADSAHLPVVFLTGDPDPETEYLALDSGADDFLSKPIPPRHLVSAVQDRVRRARLIRAAQGTAGQRDRHTGLYRRDRVLARLAQAPAAALLEIQNFPALQEKLGYAGIEALLHSAGRMLAALAPDAARLNDSSFLVLLPEEATDAARAAMARRLRDGMGQPIVQGEGMLRLRVAVAHAAMADIARDPLGLLERTLRSARSVPAAIASFEPGQVPEAGTAQTEALRTALRDGRLELAFQPIAAVAGGDEAQFQVLLRMRDDAQRLHAAADLIAQAEAAGLLGLIDRWVLEQALALLRPDGSMQARRLFVSQSPQAIAADPDGSWLRAALAAHGIPADRLVIDLRLDDALVHAVALAEYCQALAPHGVAFCLAQYVHGPDAAALLQQLPLTYLRLAPEYSGQSGEAGRRDELRNLIGVAHGAGLRVIGSHVENPAAAAALWMGGVDYIQGNLVQRAGRNLDFDFHHSVL